MLDSVLSELGASVPELAAGSIAALAIYVVVIVATRVAGLRSFSKMSAFDFAMTVAIGSLIAATASGQGSLLTVTVAVCILYSAQLGVAKLRRRGLLGGLVDNAPLLLMEDGRVLHDNLTTARVTLDDLHGKLREANVLGYDRVHAVVFETTGDISVLHGSGELDRRLLDNVRSS